VGLRTVAANGLALALTDTQHADEARADHETDNQRGGNGGPRTETEIADKVQRAGKTKIFSQYIQH
jgi:hypothetical protein